jgi:hypothetical protein
MSIESDCGAQGVHIILTATSIVVEHQSAHHLADRLLGSQDAALDAVDKKGNTHLHLILIAPDSIDEFYETPTDDKKVSAALPLPCPLPPTRHMPCDLTPRAQTENRTL